MARHKLFIIGLSVRTNLKLDATKTEDMPKTLREVIENLRGDALSAPIEIGTAALLAKGGNNKLMKAILEHIFPITRHEAKALYKEGHNTHEGVFTRQTGESMQSYILRRKRWLSLLKQLDPSVSMST